jgi:uroporphyrinogen-III synthase
MVEQSRPTLLLTRPLAQSQRFEQEFLARFGAFDCIISPILAPRFLDFALPKMSSAVIFTSETGVWAAMRGVPENLPKLAYCVGQRTAQMAAEAGFDVRSAQGDWRDLAALIAGDAPKGTLAFLCASEAPLHLQSALELAGFKVHRTEVYAQDQRPLSDEAHAALQGGRPVLLPLFSPRSARCFCAQSRGPIAPIWLAALSQNVAAAFTLQAARCGVAGRPNAASMLDAIGEILPNAGTKIPMP